MLINSSFKILGILYAYKTKGELKKMKKIRLQTKLKQDGKTKKDKIKWAYYGYGYLNCSGECLVKDLPYQVKSAVFTKIDNGIYCVDGAL